MLLLRNAARAVIRAQAAAGYPLEICGFLVGVAAGDTRTAREAWPIANAWETDPALRAQLLESLASAEVGADRWEAASEERRFLVSPRDTVAAMKRAREAGMDLIGVYHTHPNHPAVPSDYDRAAAWPEWSYLIVAVRDGVVSDERSWSLSDVDSPFVEEPVVVG